MLKRLQNTSYTAQLYSLQKAYQAFENNHKKQVAQVLKNTDYHKITQSCGYLLKNNYYVRQKYMPQDNCYSIKDLANLVLFGKDHFEKEKKIVDLFDELIEMKYDLLCKAHQQVYNQAYFQQKEDLQNKIDALKKHSPKVFSFNDNNVQTGKTSPEL
ncbi:hypothetical protein EKK58_02980 [Candidatus Dependentiae bacterium]|nr:MAG: hypothetical protein EKK58_02980 [Candidatus Dependentiae bacterium]